MFIVDSWAGREAGIVVVDEGVLGTGAGWMLIVHLPHNLQ